MPRILNRIPAHHLISGVATRAPIGRLSCPYSGEDVAGPADEDPRCHDGWRAVATRGARPEGRSNDWWTRARCGDGDRRHWCGSLTTDYWNPPTSESQRAQQRILAVIVAFVLAAVLAQAGW